VASPPPSGPIPALRAVAAAIATREGALLLLVAVAIATRDGLTGAGWWAEALEALHPAGGHKRIRVYCTVIVAWGLLPVLAVLAVARSRAWRGLCELGLRLPEARWWWVVLVLNLAQVAITPLLVAPEGMAGYYPSYPPARSGGAAFWWFEALQAIQMVPWEFGMRGLLVLGLAPRFGAWAILIHNIPFLMLHWGKPDAELMAMLVSGLIFGALAWASRSIWPGVVIHITGAFLLDAWLVYL